MRIIKSIKSIRGAIKFLKIKNKKIGFVPTMGALHNGHLSLLRKCRRENDIAVLSIFVNPEQFGQHEDFGKYPRQEKKDKLLARKEKIDIIFYPSVKNIYPKGYLTYINVNEISNVLCGKFRPRHFKGVTTVVGKLLNIVAPDVLYLGQKDAQQAVVLKKMIVDLNFPVKVKICPIIREADGLAMSSRNNYLTPKQRREAPVIFQSLKNARREILKGEHSAKKIINAIRLNILNNSSGKIDYIECVDADSLLPIKYIKGTVLVAMAIKFGNTRLIDNIIQKNRRQQ